MILKLIRIFFVSSITVLICLFITFSFRVNEFGPSYVEYLNNTQTFHNADWSVGLHAFFNLERNYLYSFMEGLDG